MQVVIGVDPGAANLGFGFVRVEGNRMSALDAGVVETSADLPIERRLERIHGSLAELIAWHEPTSLAIEDLYFGKNVRSAMAVGQASGVAMLAAAQHGIPCIAYTPQAIKMAVCGSGSAGKQQVQRMVGTLLGLPEAPDHRPRRRRPRGCDLPRRRCRAAGGDRGRRGAGERMIAAVRGEVLVRRPDHVVIDAGGVGYLLTVSAETLKSVPATGREAFLHAQLIPRDDSLALYGFASEEERELFGELVSVSGVGPKVAIAALSGGPARELLRAIAAGDAKRFQAVPGIGKRTSERIIVELREKVAGALEEEIAVVGGEPADDRSLARDGLVNLGYAPLEAEQLLDGIEGDGAEVLIATALRKAGTKRAA